MKYTLAVHTGNLHNAGTDEVAFVTAQFERASVGPIKLDRRFHDDLRRGAVDKYEIDAPDDCGDPVALIFRLSTSDDSMRANWFLDIAELITPDRTWTFPSHGWVTGSAVRIVFEATARLPSQARNQTERELRHQEIAVRRTLYPWRSNDGTLPGALDIQESRPLPADEHYRGLLDGSYQAVFAKTITAIKLTSGVFKKDFDSFDDFLELFRAFEVPSVHDRWRQDHEAGREPVQGISPTFLRAVNALPDGMVIDPKEIAFHLDPGMTIERALADGRLFLVDFAILDGIPMYDAPNEEGVVELRHAPPARALYYRETAGPLRPIAIQLGTDPATCPVFTPTDSDPDWTAAKAYLACAEGNTHQIVTHALRTHFAMEPIIMATMRNLPSAHPVFKIVRRHCRYTLAINEGARGSLIAPGGVFDLFMSTGGPKQGHVQLLKKAWTTWRLSENRLPEDLERRGVADPTKLPYYPYRDDALPLWHAISQYVRELLALSYENDAAVAGDEEVQLFWKDLTSNGMPMEKLELTALDTIDALARIIETFIFSVSVQHAAVNYAQFEHYAWVPNAPLCMRAPPPESKGMLTEAGVLAAMPSREQSTWQVAIGRSLSTIGEDEQFLLSPDGWADRYFFDEKSRAVQDRFHRLMAQQEDRVEAANQGRPSKYKLLLPSRVPTSITI